MIFKKPYAFFIKNFRLFHFILFTLSGILLYRTSLIYSFLKEYAASTPNVIGKDLTGSLFDSYSYIIIIFLILINILIIIIMIRKTKPYIFYIFNIALYIAILVTFITSHRVIGNLQVMLVEPKTILAVRDFNNIARLLETVSVFFYLVRATGFDIKKFDFSKDLKELNISEEDSEEYEVAIEFEKNEIVRKIKRQIRDFKYYYKENMLIINMIILLFISLVSLIIYLNISKYDKVYKEGEFFSAGDFNIGIKSSYIVDNDYKGTRISNKDYKIVAVKISIKSNYEQQLALTRTVLSVDGYQYYHISAYKNSLLDIGTIYTEQKITSEFNDYILVYQIPKDYTGNIEFKYIDTVSEERGKTKVNSINVLLNPNKIDNLSGESNVYELTNEIDTSKSIISDYKITINNYDLSNSYTETYNACVTNNECYDFKETIKPAVTTNKEKVLLKLEGTINYENKISNISDLYTFINNFGTIEYIYNGKKYTEKNDFNQVKFARINKVDTYYIEVDSEILEATEINLVFNIRNNKYSYRLRRNTNE